MAIGFSGVKYRVYLPGVSRKIQKMKSSNNKTQQGFTLIEVMIVVAIIGILSALAYPSYAAYLAKGRRADARVQLASAQQWTERFYSENFNYATDNANNAVSSTFSLQPFSSSPRAGDGAAVYTISLTVASTSQTYTLTAAPISGGAMVTDACGSFTLNNTGRRGVTGSEALLTCWK